MVFVRGGRGKILVLASALIFHSAAVSPAQQPQPAPTATIGADHGHIEPPRANYAFPDGHAYVYSGEWHVITAGTGTVRMEVDGKERKVVATAAVSYTHLYWEYADYLHANQHAINGDKDRENTELDNLANLQGAKHKLDVPVLQACLKAQDDKAVRASIREGEALGIDATPTIYINGQKLDGAVPADEVRLALDQALKDAGVAPPEHKPAPPEAKAPPAAPTKQ